MNNRRLSLVALGLFLFGACAYKAQVVRLDPFVPDETDVPASPVPATRHTEVTVRAVDVRASAVIGRRQEGSEHEADIKTDQDVSELLQMKISKILKYKGYRPIVEGQSGTPVLLAELKELSYKPFLEEKIRKVRIRAVLKLSAQRGAKSMEKTLTASQERKIPFEPVAKTNEEWINETLSDALKEFAKDEQLFSFLSESEMMHNH